jgi:hypothetical protein
MERRRECQLRRLCIKRMQAAHNHFITEKKFKKKSGDVTDEANFPFFFLLHKRVKPAPPPLPSLLPTRANSNPILPPYLLSLPTHPPIPHTPPTHPPIHPFLKPHPQPFCLPGDDSRTYGRLTDPKKTHLEPLGSMKPLVLKKPWSKAF